LALAADSPSNTRIEDDAFLLLRDAARQDDAAKADFYAGRLGSYPIASYVDYYRLKSRLKVLTVEQFHDFLKRHEGSAIADRLRNDWLLELGRKRDWANFDEQYPLFVLNDDTQVKCYALLSRVFKAQNVAAEARALLIAPSGYGEACSSLIDALAQSGQFDSEPPSSATARRAAPSRCWAARNRKLRKPSICLSSRWPRASAAAAPTTTSIWWRSAAWPGPASNWRCWR